MTLHTTSIDHATFTTAPRQQLRPNLYQSLVAGEAKLAVIGLGYVGLPIALEFARSMSVVGFDIKPQRVSQMEHAIDPSGELPAEAFADRTIQFTCQQMALRNARFYIVAVPTPVGADKTPDLRALKAATQTVANVLQPGDIVVFESTVYPGCTEEVCLPILESTSGLKLNQDFKIGYSPERINPGDTQNTLTTIKKIVSGSDEEALQTIADVYSHIISAGVFRAASIKVAEAAKVVENTQRDVNIGLMNELSNVFRQIGINTTDVLAAAGSKWNFLPFYPGLVGGHCIGVDPYYLSYKAKHLGVATDIINSTRHTNDEMPRSLAYRILDALSARGIEAGKANILVRGITFKENVQDIRNSKTAEMVQHLMAVGAEVTVEDPLAVDSEVQDEYGFSLHTPEPHTYDAIVLAVPHQAFAQDGLAFYQEHFRAEPLLFDIRGMLRTEAATAGIEYHSL